MALPRLKASLCCDSKISLRQVHLALCAHLAYFFDPMNWKLGFYNPVTSAKTIIERTWLLLYTCAPSLAKFEGYKLDLPLSLQILLKLEDNRLIETVGIPVDDDKGPSRLTACVSSQVL